jgi:hypothetical protein
MDKQLDNAVETILYLEERCKSLEALTRKAVDRLTDNDCASVPNDLRHTWVNQASQLLASFVPVPKDPSGI